MVAKSGSSARLGLTLRFNGVHAAGHLGIIKFFFFFRGSGTSNLGAFCAALKPFHLLPMLVSSLPITHAVTNTPKMPMKIVMGFRKAAFIEYSYVTCRYWSTHVLCRGSREGHLQADPDLSNRLPHS